jgi:hypothetical protein
MSKNTFLLFQYNWIFPASAWNFRCYMQAGKKGRNCLLCIYTGHTCRQNFKFTQFTIFTLCSSCNVCSTPPKRKLTGFVQVKKCHNDDYISQHKSYNIYSYITFSDAELHVDSCWSKVYWGGTATVYIKISEVENNSQKITEFLTTGIHVVHSFSSVAYVWIRGAKTTGPILKTFGFS